MRLGRRGAAMWRFGNARCKIQRKCSDTLATSGLPGGPAQNVVRIEVRPVETVTLKTQQVLTGDRNGKPVTIAGELRIPKPGNEKLAAVILLHGSGGVGAATDRWAQQLNATGIAAFI